MEINTITGKIVDIAYQVHTALGPGLLESVYEKCLAYELEQKGYQVLRQAFVPINYGKIILNSELKIDLLVNNTVVIELKTVEKILPLHEAQLLTYMKLLKAPQGLIVNFYTDNISKSYKPYINKYFNDLPE